MRVMRGLYVAAVSLTALSVCGLLLLWSPAEPRPSQAELTSDVLWEDTAGGSYAYRFSSHFGSYPGVLLSDISLDCLPPGTATVQQGGRLGNLILEYVSLWTAARIYDLSAFVPEELYNRLIDVFERLDLPPRFEFLSKTSCPPYMVERAQYSLVKMKQEEQSLSQIVDHAKQRRMPLVLELCVILVETIVPLVDEVRKNFRYREEYRNHAQEKLNSIKTTVLAADPSIQQVVFVGVHVRRTDYAAQLRLLYGVPSLADQHYFGRALLFLKSKVVGELVPVVASDDPQWVEDVLLPHLRNLGFVHSYMAGDGRLEAPENDLVVLSSCNHSVLAYGTYGIWSAIMSGGRVVVYNLNHGDAMSPAMQFAKHLPGWVALQ